MRMIRLEEEREYEEFAKRAASCFADDKTLYTYTDGDIIAGCLFAMRFGLGDDCVVVMKLDEYIEPMNFQQLITYNDKVSLNERSER